jgi:hypothetical protein
LREAAGLQRMTQRGRDGLLAHDISKSLRPIAAREDDVRVASLAFRCALLGHQENSQA